MGENEEEYNTKVQKQLKPAKKRKVVRRYGMSGAKSACMYIYQDSSS